MADRDPDPVPAPSLELDALKWVALLLARSARPATPRRATQAQRSPDRVVSPADPHRSEPWLTTFPTPWHPPHAPPPHPTIRAPPISAGPRDEARPGLVRHRAGSSRATGTCTGPASGSVRSSDVDLAVSDAEQEGGCGGDCYRRQVFSGACAVSP